MTQLIEWDLVNSSDFPMPYRHRVHQRLMHIQQNAVVQRRLNHKSRRFQPYRPYNGNLY
jgi:hypothetical protein